MNGFIQLLGWLLLALTFIGSFRLSQYLARPDDTVLYPGLIASTITAVFVIIVDVIILITGVLAIAMPTIWAVQRFTGYGPSIDVFLPAIPNRNTGQDSNTDHGEAPAPNRRPLLDVVGRLQDRVHRHLRTWLYRNNDQDPAQIDIVELEDEDYWEDND